MPVTLRTTITVEYEVHDESTAKDRCEHLTPYEQAQWVTYHAGELPNRIVFAKTERVNAESAASEFHS